MVNLHVSVALFLWMARFGVSQDAPVCPPGGQINSCSCETDQGLVDLSPLDSGNPSQPKFTGATDSSGDSHSYNPCSPFTTSTGCTDVAACLSRYGSELNSGEQTNAAFETPAPAGGLRIKYPTSDGSNWVTYVYLVCDQSQEGTLTSQGEDPPYSNNFHLTLTSKYACPGSGGGGGGGGGLSVGSILLIILTVVIVVYLVGGVLYNRFAKGATGLEMLPNIEFWRELPGLIRDGCLFIWHKIRGTTTGYQET